VQTTGEEPSCEQENPGGQKVQYFEPDNEYWPMLHGTGGLDWTSQEKPAGQRVQFS
jgi:G:T/U-mismatch repair DNA glycosylase